MHFQLLTVAATLAGLSAASPGYSWSNAPTFPGKTSTTTVQTTAPSGKTTKLTYSAPSSSSIPVKGSTVGTCTNGSTVTTTVTTCTGGPSGYPTPSSCILSPAKATSIINTYETLINRDIHGAEYNATADALLSDSYSLTSNSVNADEGIPLGAITIPSKEVFISLFWNLPEGNGETTLDIFNSCDQIAWRWLGTNPSNQTVRGITTMTITSAFQIGPVFTEYFNPTLDRCA